MSSPLERVRQISSRLTFATKFISPVLILAASAWVLFPLKVLWPGGVFVGVFMGAIISYHLWTSYRIKKVLTDGDNLYVSDYFKETTLPLDHIVDVTEVVGLEPRVVTIHLKTPSVFGSKIVFLAPWRFYNGFRTHPVVNELKQMAGLAMYKEVNGSWLS